MRARGGERVQEQESKRARERESSRARERESARKSLCVCVSVRVCVCLTLCACIYTYRLRSLSNRSSFLSPRSGRPQWARVPRELRRRLALPVCERNTAETHTPLTNTHTPHSHYPLISTSTPEHNLRLTRVVSALVFRIWV